MRGQHDPDFQPDGVITVFDNRPGGRPGSENRYRGAMGGSRIPSIDPQTRARRTVFDGAGGEAF